jgi:hypothetical protein
MATTKQTNSIKEQRLSGSLQQMTDAKLAAILMFFFCMTLMYNGKSGIRKNVLPTA